MYGLDWMFLIDAFASVSIASVSLACHLACLEIHTVPFFHNLNDFVGAAVARDWRAHRGATRLHRSSGSFSLADSCTKEVSTEI